MYICIFNAIGPDDWTSKDFSSTKEAGKQLCSFFARSNGQTNWIEER